MPEKFPVADLITAIMGEAAPGIIEAVGDVSYKVKYTPTFNDDKTVISMAFTPEPLILEINFPKNLLKVRVKEKVKPRT